MYHQSQGFIQDFGMGGEGGEQDDSRIILACKMHVCLLGGSTGIPPPPRKISNLKPLRLLLTQSGTKFPNNILMTHMFSNM